MKRSLVLIISLASAATSWTMNDKTIIDDLNDYGDKLAKDLKQYYRTGYSPSYPLSSLNINPVQAPIATPVHDHNDNNQAQSTPMPQASPVENRDYLCIYYLKGCSEIFPTFAKCHQHTLKCAYSLQRQLSEKHS